MKDIHDTRGMRGADCNTDHIMINSVCDLTVRKKLRKSRQPYKKLNIDRLKDHKVQEQLKTSMNAKLKDSLTGTLEEQWNKFKTEVYQTAKDTLGTVRKKT